jgi:HSP20 family molecular chaperone IbpA
MPSQNDLEAWMWMEACKALSQAERLQQQFFRSRSPAAAGAAVWEPPVDMVEDEHELLIVVAMPGVPAERVQVAHEGGALLVRGARPLPIPRSGCRVRSLEIPHGVFERRIALPPGRFQVGPPTLRDGCLVLQLIKL